MRESTTQIHNIATAKEHHCEDLYKIVQDLNNQRRYTQYSLEIEYGKQVTLAKTSYISSDFTEIKQELDTTSDLYFKEDYYAGYEAEPCINCHEPNRETMMTWLNSYGPVCLNCLNHARKRITN